MGSRCLDLVSSRHREPWGWLELGGSEVALAGGRMIQCGNLSGKPTFLAPRYGTAER
jgi:hypothetical protein